MLRKTADATVAYLAGFFDGEGNIRVACNSKNARGHYLRISATQVNPAPLNRLQLHFGGHLYQRPARQSKKDGFVRQPIWDWIAAGPGAAVALEALLPYLIVKAEAAKLGLAFHALVRPRKGSRSLLTDTELADRRFYADALRVRTNHQRQGGIGPMNQDQGR